VRLQTRLYITTQGCTDVATARELAFEMAAPLDELYERSVISGYQSLVLKTEDDYEEYDLDRPMIERETRGVFPAIFLNITCRIDSSPSDVPAPMTSAPDLPADISAIDPVIAKYAFRHMLTESDAP
jgi:hypothetical protein